jgi:hypothetical protein
MNSCAIVLNQGPYYYKHETAKTVLEATSNTWISYTRSNKKITRWNMRSNASGYRTSGVRMMDRLRNVAHERNRWAPAPLHSPQNNSSHIVYKKRFLQIKRQPWLSVWFWVFREWSRWYLGKTKMWSRPPDLRKYGIWLRTCREWKIAHLRRKLVDVLRLKHTWVKWSDYFGVGSYTLTYVWLISLSVRAPVMRTHLT